MINTQCDHESSANPIPSLLLVFCRHRWPNQLVILLLLSDSTLTAIGPDLREHQTYTKTCVTSEGIAHHSLWDGSCDPFVSVEAKELGEEQTPGPCYTMHSRSVSYLSLLR